MKSKNNKEGFELGDIFYSQSENGYELYKLLAIDKEFEIYHVLCYSTIDHLLPISDVEKIPVMIYHSPFDKKAFEDCSLLTNRPITSSELIGYHEYLRQTSSPEFYTQIAIDYFNDGLRLTDENKHDEAIDAYSKAIDLVPAFYEAIDNRAFCKMDLAEWEDAIIDFRFSLQQNPNSLLAEFSIGECYLKMGDYENAKHQFEIAYSIDPDDELTNQFLVKVGLLLSGKN